MPDQVLGARDVAFLAGGELELDRSALPVDKRMDFCGKATSGTTQTSIKASILAPLFAVAPCWWTRTMEVSIICTSPS
jgi:hypothetical protein